MPTDGAVLKDWQDKGKLKYIKYNIKIENITQIPAWAKIVGSAAN